MDIIFNLFKVRFKILDEILSKDTDICHTDKVNVFINLEPIIKKLMASNVEDYVKVSNENVQNFASNILNLAAHYRLFFSKNKLYSKIYLYMPNATSNINTIMNPDYRSTFTELMNKKQKNRHFSRLITESSDVISIISEYIEGVYYIDSKNIENSLIPMIISKNIDEDYKNVIISTDRYDYQYATLGFDIIVPKKENSHIINSNNIMDRFKTKEKVLDESIIDPKLYSFILSIMGDKKRDIPKISRMGLKTIIKMLNIAKEKGIISDNVNNINILSNIIRDDCKTLLLTNFYCTDIMQQYNRLGQYDIFMVTKQLKDKYDDESLKKINNLYFPDSPISLLEICSGTKFKEHKKLF